MKVKTFLNKLMMNSSLDKVYVQKNGYIKEEYDEADLRLQDYGAWGNETVKTFYVSGEYLYINV